MYTLSDAQKTFLEAERRCRKVTFEAVNALQLAVKREAVLMTTVEKMVGAHQSCADAEFRDKFYKLFELAKRIHHAVDNDELRSAIDDLIKT